MANVRQHLHDLHKREAQHHTVKAEHHAVVAGHYRTLSGAVAKAEGQADSKVTLEALAGLHEKLSAEHTNMANHHADKAEACAKAVDTGDLTKRDGLVPTAISVVAPNVHAVPRAGMQPLPEKPNVSPQFRKVVEIEDSNMEATAL